MSSSDNIQELSNQFQTLRNVQGHYMGGDFNEQVDAPNGAKHNAMKVNNVLFYLSVTIEAHTLYSVTY